MDEKDMDIGASAAASADAPPLLDLQPFCGTDECRFYLMKPFSRSGFTWATGGSIMIRVPCREDVPELEIKIAVERPLAGIGNAEFYRPQVELPSAQATERCPYCDGRGYLHDCPDCQCKCTRCDGSGDLDLERVTSTGIGPHLYALNYIRQVLALPDVELAVMTAEMAGAPLFFRFNGGVGALMPLRAKHERHVEIERGAS